MEPSQHKGVFQHGRLGIFHFIFLPAGFEHFIRSHLEGIFEQGIELLQIPVAQFPHGEQIAVLHIVPHFPQPAESVRPCFDFIIV